MALSTTLSKVRIEGNSIDTGTYSNGVSVTDYTYSYAMDISASGTIKNNIISGCIGSSTTSTNLVSISNASCNISGNQFVRGSSDLNAYINITGTNDQIITGNVFDKSEASSGDELLVKGLTENSTYNNNKNQTCILPITIVNYVNTLTVFTKTELDVVYTSFSVGSTSQAQVIFFVPLSKHIPRGAQIKSIKLGISPDPGAPTPTVDTGGDNFVGIGIYAHAKNSNNFDAGTGCGVLDYASNTLLNSWIDTLSFDSAPLFTTFISGNQYLTSTINDNYNTSDDTSELGAVIEVACKLGSGNIAIVLSPLVVKYTY